MFVELINADLVLILKLVYFMVVFLNLSQEIYGNVKLGFGSLYSVIQLLPICDVFANCFELMG